MNNEILENHQRYLERKKLYTTFGYDIDNERNFVLEQAKPLGGKILDAGTGKGYFAITLAEQGYSFTAFDISPEELRLAKLNLAYFRLDKNVDFRIEDAEQTSFVDGSFDVIFSVNTLHHFQNPYKVIDEFIRILSPNGKLILSDFTEDGFAVIDKIHASEGKTHSTGSVNFSDVELYLEKKGFSVKKTQSTLQNVIAAGKGLI